MGHINRPVSLYDIGSAYPFAFTHAPNLALGSWSHLTSKVNPLVLSDISIVLIKWEYHNSYVSPFPCRYPGNRVGFPSTGTRWIMNCELRAVLDTWNLFPGLHIHFLEAYEFKEHDGSRPFSFLVDEFVKRQTAVLQGNSGLAMILKLALNAVYGKHAQKVGYDPITKKLPAWYNLIYAAFVTAYTRSMVWRLIAPNPESILAIMTDGVLTLSDINPPAGLVDAKTLGGWEVKNYDEAVLVQAGVRFLRSGTTWFEASRGLEAPPLSGTTAEEWSACRQTEIIRRKDLFLSAWKKGENKVSFNVTRFIALRRAVAYDTTFPLLGSWIKESRTLDVVPHVFKRNSSLRIKSLYDTYNQTSSPLNVLDYLNFPCVVPWSKDDDADENLALHLGEQENDNVLSKH